MSKIVIQSEEIGFVSPCKSIHSDDLFYHSSYLVQIDLGAEIYSFSIQPSGWLKAYTSFLNGEYSHVREHLTLSGEYFEAEKDNGGMKLNVFDLSLHKSLVLSISNDLAKKLHQAILARMKADVEAVCGQNASLADSEAFVLRNRNIRNY